ncbi:MAG TPA: DMT family transporter [Patescibacteria group bacterium]|nr:DMT family transporter [Patescibacteria group bacterium]
MSWLFLILASVLFFSISTIVHRILMKSDKSDPAAYMIVFQFLVTFMIVIYMTIFRVALPNILPVLPNLLLNGVLIGAASLFMFKALKFTDASEYTILHTSATFWTIIASAIFLNEIITFNKILGTILIILGVIIVTWRQKKQKLVFHKGHLYTLISSTAFGLAFTNEVFIVGQIGVLQNLVIGFFLPGLFVLLIKPKAIYTMKLLLKVKNLFSMTVFSLFYLFGAVTIFAAYRAGGDASQLYPISNLSVISTVILAAIFLRERSHLGRKILGALAAFAGLWFLQ